MGKSKKQVRTRNYAMICYLSRSEIEEYCSKVNISNYAYIPHNKDVYEEDIKDENGNVIHHKGDLKAPHFHIVVTYENARTLSAVKGDFIGYSQNTFVEYVKDLESSLAYLTHKNNPEKYQYPLDIVCSNYGYFRGEYSSVTLEDNTAFRIINDMEKGYNHFYLVRKYGRDYVINYKRYADMQNLCFGRDIDDENTVLRKQLQDMRDMLEEVQAENRKLRFENSLLERSLTRSRKNVMVLTTHKQLVMEKVPKHIEEECPF